MSKSKKSCCCCPTNTRKKPCCEHAKMADYKDVAEIVEALTFEAEERHNKKSVKQRRSKIKQCSYVPTPHKDICEPLTPSMNTRVRFIEHCPPEPAKFDSSVRTHEDNCSCLSSSAEDFKEKFLDGGGKNVYEKKVRYCELQPEDALLPMSKPVVKHADSDACVLTIGTMRLSGTSSWKDSPDSQDSDTLLLTLQSNLIHPKTESHININGHSLGFSTLPMTRNENASHRKKKTIASPKTSGEVVAVARTPVEPSEFRPPLPPKSGHALFKPHSGIVINKNDAFSPDFDVDIGKEKGQDDKKKPLSCGKKICGRCHRNKTSKSPRHLENNKGRRRKRHRGGGDGPRRKRTFRPEDSICATEDIPELDHPRLRSHLKRGTMETHSLTVVPCRNKDNRPDVPYGILSGSMNIFSQKFGSASRGKQASPVCVMAYCLAFHYHPKQWTVKLVDNLLEAGDLWYQQCASKLHDHTPYKGICEVLQFGKKQTIVLNGKRMKVLLGDPEVIGYTMSVDPTVYNLCKGLTVFFNDNRAGLLLTRVLKVVIWKDKICYFIFDPAGRDSKAYSNFSNGCASLINVKDLNDVIEILLARSIVDNQKFAIAPVKVLKMIDEKEEDDLESEKEFSLTEKALMGYRILDENCAIANATMHLGDRCFEDAKYRQALTIAVAALTYAKISPPNRWHTKTVDKILRLGTKLFLDCSQPGVMLDLIVDNIPNSIIIGPYACEIIIYKDRVKGQLFASKDCLINIHTALRDFFSKEYSSGILQFNNYSLAIWRQKEMFYMLDPYPRTSNGLRANKGGKGCVWMLLNTDCVADIIQRNWFYMPPSTQFTIHAFKILKLRKKEEKMKLVCSLSDEKMPLAKREIKRVVLEPHDHAQEHGIGNEVLEVFPVRDTSENLQIDEEHLGDIVSLVDSIQDEYLPAIPPKYKVPEADVSEPKVVNLDSPTVSVTQIVPRWPKPRDKTNEPPDPDPDPEPEPQEPQAPGEGAEEAAEEENAEEEEGGKKEEADELVLPPPLPPPPPSPQSEPELVPVECAEDEVPTVPPEEVPRRILLTADARQRSKMRAMKKKKPQPVIAEIDLECTPSTELAKPHNFKELPDGAEIISATSAITDKNDNEILPFVAIMAIVTSYKYSINTWSRNIVNFVLDAAKQLYQKRQANFQSAPVHIIPKITIGSQAYSAHISIYQEGVTWQLEEVLKCDFFEKYCKAIITTSRYSCAVFKKNCLFYMYDGTPCSSLGLRNCDGKGKAALMRFRTLHELLTRFSYNKDGLQDEQHFILSRVVVRRVLQEPRLQLPEDYDFYKREPKSTKSKPKIIDDKPHDVEQEVKSATLVGYQLINGQYRIEGTCSLKERCVCSGNVRECHFVCVVAMLLATIHPIHTWDHFMIDVCIEKGLEIYSKVSSYKPCDKRVIKNLFLDGKFINLNIKKLLVINDNVNKSLEQYIKAVLRRLRYVIVTFPECSIVICQVDSYFHLFDPYCSNTDENAVPPNTAPDPCVCKSSPVASWSLYYTVDDLVQRLQHITCFNNPDFYTFELTSIKPAPRHASINYRLSPLFKQESNPNFPYVQRKKTCPIVNEKMYWLDIQFIPWSRTRGLNSMGLERGCMVTMWKDWDIEFPGDLYSLWGTLHPTNPRFEESRRGNQYLAICTVAIVMTQCCDFSAWTSGLVDGIVINGDKYYAKSIEKLNQPNHEILPDDLNNSYGEMYPISFSVKFDKVIFGFVYNIFPDRFNLSNALTYFFESHRLGIFISPTKCLAFGKVDDSYFMFDCQSFAGRLFTPGRGVAYILKCESLNRLIYCITLTLNIRRHGVQFHLYSVNVKINEK